MWFSPLSSTSFGASLLRRRNHPPWLRYARSASSTYCQSTTAAARHEWSRSQALPGRRLRRLATTSDEKCGIRGTGALRRRHQHRWQRVRQPLPDSWKPEAQARGWGAPQIFPTGCLLALQAPRPRISLHPNPSLALQASCTLPGAGTGHAYNHGFRRRTGGSRFHLRLPLSSIPRGIGSTLGSRDGKWVLSKPSEVNPNGIASSSPGFPNPG